MLEKMSNAMPVGSFVSRTGLDPDSKRHAFHVGHCIGGYRQSIGKTRYFNTHKQTAPCIPALVLVSEPVFFKLSNGGERILPRFSGRCEEL
jgi:hypothetical protein